MSAFWAPESADMQLRCAKGATDWRGAMGSPRGCHSTQSGTGWLIPPEVITTLLNQQLSNFPSARFKLRREALLTAMLPEPSSTNAQSCGELLRVLDA
ncbi:hypothetical protein AC579_1501 [Pseudocercospora musae]|uniref:Uncharacterized protein n=1 Tax=Pseudocercospora musae TaxID=113226 RepID=A0A139IK92_9PEZI|nr:hypothetical protein AC579_1501 [Pseudocercospora musae]